MLKRLERMRLRTQANNRDRMAAPQSKRDRLRQ